MHADLQGAKHELHRITEVLYESCWRLARTTLEHDVSVTSFFCLSRVTMVPSHTERSIEFLKPARSNSLFFTCPANPRLVSGTINTLWPPRLGLPRVLGRSIRTTAVKRAVQMRLCGVDGALEGVILELSPGSTLRHQISTLSRHPDTPTPQCQSTLGPTLRHQCQASVKPS